MTKEKLLAQIEQLQRDHQTHLEQAFMCLGAIQAAQYWVREMEKAQGPAPVGPQLVPDPLPIEDYHVEGDV